MEIIHVHRKHQYRFYDIVLTKDKIVTNLYFNEV